MQLVCLVKE
jgi:hypothetical protein